MVVVSGLAQHQADAFDDGANGDHTRGTSSWLTGVHCKRTEGADVRNGISADQIAAQALGAATPLPSLELAIDLNFLAGQCENSYSCAYLNTLAWQSSTSPQPTENNPRIVFERLFGDGGTPAQRQAQARENRSLLDSVMADLARLQKDLGPSDRARVGEYLDAVREVEGRIQRAERRGPDETLASLDRPAGIPGRFDEHVKLMFELQWLAFRGDLTRVVTFIFRTRAQLPHLSGDRHQRRPSRAVASSGQPGAAGEVRASEHVPVGALRLVPREAARDAGRRRVATRSLAVPLRRRIEQPEPARALRSAAGGGRRRGRRARRPARGLPPGDADDEPASVDAGPRWRADGDAGRQHGTTRSAVGAAFRRPRAG